MRSQRVTACGDIRIFAGMMGRSRHDWDWDREGWRLVSSELGCIMLTQSYIVPPSLEEEEEANGQGIRGIIRTASKFSNRKDCGVIWLDISVCVHVV